MTLEEVLEKLKSGNCPSGLQINLRGNRIGDEGAQALAVALASGNCPSDLQLDLYANKIGGQGAQALAEALVTGNCRPGLQLKIDNNEIGDDGVQALAKALATGNCPSGLHLNISCYHIGDEGAQALAEALTSGNCPPGLQFNLNCTLMRGKGAKVLAEAINSKKCPFGTAIILKVNMHPVKPFTERYNLAELSKANDRRIQKLTSLQLITLIGGYSQCKRHMPLTAESKLSEDVVNHVAKFLPGNIAVSMLLNKLEQFFITTLNNTAEFSDEFLQKHSSANQRIQNKYDKKYGLSLWKCTEDYRKRYLETNPIKTGTSDKNMCAIL
jgi:hypothetical protein